MIFIENFIDKKTVCLFVAKLTKENKFKRRTRDRFQACSSLAKKPDDFGWGSFQINISFLRFKLLFRTLDCSLNSVQRPNLKILKSFFESLPKLRMEIALLLQTRNRPIEILTVVDIRSRDP